MTTYCICWQQNRPRGEPEAPVHRGPPLRQTTHTLGEGGQLLTVISPRTTAYAHTLAHKMNVCAARARHWVSKCAAAECESVQAQPDEEDDDGLS